MPQSDMDSSSGLIMGVIRILTNSQNDEERDVIKKKLEDYLVASDEKLTKLVAKHHEELRQVMQIFTSISNNLHQSSSKLSRTKKRLTDCRQMLTSRLEELSRLSEESRKNEKILAIFDQVDELLKVPLTINSLMNGRQYLKAVQLLIETQKQIDDNFEAFDCLREVRTELDTKKDEIYRILIERILLVDDENVKAEIVASINLIAPKENIIDLEVVKDKTTSTSTKPYLFRFALSSHAICFNEHYKEQIEVTKTLLSK